MDYEIVMVPISKLKIDHTYQRINISQKVVNNIIRKFNWKAFDELSVSKRADGSLYLLDGIHRTEACKQLSIKKVPCRIFTGLTIQQEAEICNIKMYARKKTTCAESFKSGLVANDLNYIEINNILEANNIKISFVHNGGKKLRERGLISCFNIMIRIYNISVAHFKNVFNILNKLYYIDEKWDEYALSQAMVSGMDYFIRYTDYDKLNIDKLIKKCGGHMMPKKYITIASANAAILGRGSLPKQLAIVMLQDYNLGLRLENKIEFKSIPGI